MDRGFVTYPQFMLVAFVVMFAIAFPTGTWDLLPLFLAILCAVICVTGDWYDAKVEPTYQTEYVLKRHCPTCGAIVSITKPVTPAERNVDGKPQEEKTKD